MYESNPAGTRACQACGKKKVATITVRDESGSLTACDDCRRPFEELGYTTARAVELAVAKRRRTFGGPAYNRAIVKRYRRLVDQHRREEKGQLLFIESEAFDKREARKQKRAAAQRRRRAAA